MKFRRGRLICEHSGEMTVEYVPHAQWFNGVPSYIELLNLAESLEQDELVTLRTPEGDLYNCRVLDSKPDCAVIATL